MPFNMLYSTVAIIQFFDCTRDMSGGDTLSEKNTIYRLENVVKQESSMQMQ